MEELHPKKILHKPKFSKPKPPTARGAKKNHAAKGKRERQQLVFFIDIMNIELHKYERSRVVLFRKAFSACFFLYVNSYTAFKIS